MSPTRTFPLVCHQLEPFPLYVTKSWTWEPDGGPRILRLYAKRELFFRHYGWNLNGGLDIKHTSKTRGTSVTVAVVNKIQPVRPVIRAAHWAHSNPILPSDIPLATSPCEEHKQTSSILEGHCGCIEQRFICKQQHRTEDMMEHSGST